MSNEYAGTSLYLKFGTIVYSGDFRTFTVDDTGGQINATAGADTREVIINGAASGRATATILDLLGGSIAWNGIARGTSGTLEWGEEGTASTKQKHTVYPAVVIGRSKSVPYDDVVTINVEWSLQAATTDSVY